MTATSASYVVGRQTLQLGGDGQLAVSAPLSAPHTALGLLPLPQVRPPGGQQSPYYEELAKAAEAAEAKGVGMYTKVRWAAGQSMGAA